jgi:hypothetical protein
MPSLYELRFTSINDSNQTPTSAEFYGFSGQTAQAEDSGDEF